MSHLACIFLPHMVQNLQLCILVKEKVNYEYLKMENILFNIQPVKHRYPAI